MHSSFQQNKHRALRVSALATVGGLLVMFLLIDYAIGRKQRAIVTEREAKIKRLEEQAFLWISAEIRDITYPADIESSEQYEALLRVDSVADEPVYVSHPLVQAYMQTGKVSWIELPVEDKKGEPKEQMYKIEDNRLRIRKLLTIDRSIPYNRYLIRKYMHIKFVVSMNVLPESGFKEGEVVERRSSTFIYLKPYYVSRREIREEIDWGDTRVPVFMPITSFRNWDMEE
jgi:hypothetical protein